MKNKLITFIALVFAAAFVFGTIPCHAAVTSGDALLIFDGILKSKGQENDPDSIQALIDGELTETAGLGSEWFIFALAQNGEYDFSAYGDALLSYLDKNEVGAASSRLKYALCLSAIGHTDAYIQRAIDSSVGKQGLMSFVFGLHLLNNGYSAKNHTKESIKSMLLSLQCEDGGWAISGQRSDADATAMVIQALAPFGNEDTAVSSAIDRALTLLSEKQLESGCYTSYGEENPESAAQVIIALLSLGIDPLSDERFIKNGVTLLDGILKFRLDDGSFCHFEGGKSNGTSTSQVLLSAVAYMRFLDGNAPIYKLDLADPENAEPAGDVTEPTKESKDIDYRLPVCLGICACALIACALLFIMKKRNVKNFIAVLVAAAALILTVSLTDIKPADDYYGDLPKKENTVGSVTISIRCDKIAGLDGHVPENGIILAPESFEICAGDTVYSILIEAAKKHKISIENDGSATMPYISGIAYIYEHDFGDLSGWVYTVNGERASVGAAEYTLRDGDIIEWHYTKSFGEDIE